MDEKRSYNGFYVQMSKVLFSSIWNLKFQKKWKMKLQWMMKQYKVLRFKRVKNEAKMIVIFKRVRIEVRSGFNIQPSQEWSYKWFSRSNESRLKLKWSTFTNEYRMNLEGALKVETSKE